ncbi:MAG TPA: hypothetical protein VFB38_27185 [Chthonomonadaceae bacterium]|nr:hypothetical protein [Chthonomonadaceae bacterium]
MHKWHYKTVVIRELALSEAKINAEGEQGWELVAVVMTDEHTARAFFKKQGEALPEDHPVTAAPHAEPHAAAHPEHAAVVRR